MGVSAGSLWYTWRYWHQPLFHPWSSVQFNGSALDSATKERFRFPPSGQQKLVLGARLRSVALHLEHPCQRLVHERSMVDLCRRSGSEFLRKEDSLHIQARDVV